MAVVPAPPVVSSLAEYQVRLGEVDFWAPYVRAVLARHAVPAGRIEVGYVGTYPTFLVGRVVVKLFGWFPSWRENHRVELAAHRLLADDPGAPAPALLAHGRLYGVGAPWPYLVTRRLPGRTLRDLRLPPAHRRRLARDLGAAVRRVHAVPVPAAGPLRRDRPHDRGARWRDRHLAWGSLPAAQVRRYGGGVALSGMDLRLVHGDLTAEHIFVADGELAGIIDWGDALVTDPYYELGALHLGAFRADPALLAAFRDGYGWPAGPDFVPRAMGAALRHRHDLFVDLPDRLRPDRFASLDAFATALWSTPRPDG